MKQFLLSGVMASCLTMTGFSADWATWLGPNADGISAEEVKPSGTVTWTKELGAGYSAVSVKDGKVLAIGNVNDKDVLYCLNEDTGEEIWTYTHNSEAGRPYAGPLGTPVTDGEKVWYLNRWGEIVCVDFASGKLLWTVYLVSNSAYLPRWMCSSSVVLYKDLAIVNFGRHGAAVKKDTGYIEWVSDGESTHSTPTLMSTQGKDYLINISGRYISVADPVDGALIDQVAFPQEYDIVGASPIVIDAEKGLFLISAGYTTGRCILFSFDGKKMTEVWTVKHMNSQFSTPIYHDGVVYGCNANTNGRNALSAIDVKTGELLWKGTLRFGSPLIAGDKLIYLDERGELTFLNIDKTKESIIESHQVLKGGKCWQMPVLANGYIYCRNSLGSLVCIKVK